MLSIDEIKCTLKCVKLGWQRASSRAGQLISAPKFALIPLGSLGGYVSLVRKDLANDTLNGSCRRKG